MVAQERRQNDSLILDEIKAMRVVLNDFGIKLTRLESSQAVLSERDKYKDERITRHKSQWMEKYQSLSDVLEGPDGLLIMFHDVKRFVQDLQNGNSETKTRFLDVAQTVGTWILIAFLGAVLFGSGSIIP